MQNILQHLYFVYLVYFVFAGPPCRTWSLARQSGPGPPVLRDAEHIYGFPKSQAHAGASGRLQLPFGATAAAAAGLAPLGLANLLFPPFFSLFLLRLQYETKLFLHLKFN